MINDGIGPQLNNIPKSPIYHLQFQKTTSFQTGFEESNDIFRSSGGSSETPQLDPGHNLAESTVGATRTNASEELTWSWFFGQLASIRIILAFASLFAIFMIIRYLRTIYGKMIKTHFQIYCIILSCSDFCISISGVCTVTGVFKFIDSPVLSTV